MPSGSSPSYALQLVFSCGQFCTQLPTTGNDPVRLLYCSVAKIQTINMKIQVIGFRRQMQACMCSKEKLNSE